MTKNTNISVVVPLYNKQETILRAINSVLNQSFKNFEVIVVDDGSTDKSLAAVQTISDKRIRIITQPNLGVGAARNTGIRESRFDFIAFLDADDQWHPKFLEALYRLYLDYPSCSVFATKYAMKYSNGEIRPITLRQLPFCKETGILTNYFEVACKSHPPICSINLMINKNALNSIGNFPINSIAGEDLLTWARLATKFRIAYNTSYIGAYFNIENESLKNPPKRIPAKVDIIGNELSSLYKANKNILYLKEYVSHWHKMRSSMFMRLGDSYKCCKEAIIALRYNSHNYKVAFYVALSILPAAVRRMILK